MLRTSLIAALTLLALALLAAPAMARPVEVLNGQVKAVGHAANGRAAVVVDGGRRTLTLRRFRLAPGPRVRVWLVPAGVRGDGRIPRDRIDLGALKGSRGDQSYRVPGRVDLRRYSSVVFWCVPFTQTLARADLRRS